MIRKTFIFSLVLLILTVAWNFFVPEFLHSPPGYFIILYFSVSTIIVHRFLIRTNNRSPKDFIRAYMGSTALRLFMNLVIIMIYILLDRDHAMVFTLSFLLFYFCFLVFEIISLQNDLKKA